LDIKPTLKTTANRRLAKKRVQCLNEVLCFVSNLVLAESLLLRNPLLRQAPNRQRQHYERTVTDNCNDLFKQNDYDIS